MQDFAGKVAVITGAASGMGLAYARRFAAEGMKVVLTDIEQPALEAAVAELKQQQHEVTGALLDVADAAAMRDLADRAYHEYGAVHLLCNNAGVEGYLRGPIWDASDLDWQWTFGVNFWGVVNGVRAFLPRMLAAGAEGHIVNTASTMGLVAGANMYGITKHAVVAFSETLRLNLEQQQALIGVSVLCPGLVNTRIFQGWRNRPVALRNPGEAHGPQRSGGPDLTNAMPPARVAEIVLQAVRERRFYVLTDHDWDERMETRWQAIRERR